ncbi:hypothetical protein U1Q18_019958 [Sarracenia purpurea var. burkii]
MEALPTPEPAVFSLTVADIATDYLRWVLLSQKHCKTHTQRCGAAAVLSSATPCRCESRVRRCHRRIDSVPRC